MRTRHQFNKRNINANCGIWISECAGMVITVLWHESRLQSFTHLSDAIEYAQDLTRGSQA